MIISSEFENVEKRLQNPEKHFLRAFARTRAKNGHESFIKIHSQIIWLI